MKPHVRVVHGGAFETCPECGGATVQFRGQGRDLAYRVCSRWLERGHLDEHTVRQKIREERRRHGWVGRRFA